MLTAVDNSIPTGFNGVVASAAWNNRVFWDATDIAIPGGGPGGPDGDPDGHVGAPGSSCACDWTNDNTVNSQDFFEYLAAFFAQAPDADVNSDESVNSQDFFEFLACFFSGRVVYRQRLDDVRLRLLGVLALPVAGNVGDLLLGHPHALQTQRRGRTAAEIQHVTAPQQAFRARLIEVIFTGK